MQAAIGVSARFRGSFNHIIPRKSFPTTPEKGRFAHETS
jgi:hypothetical protein